MIHGDSDCPDVGFFCILFVNDFWSHISWSSNSGGKNFILLNFGGDSKVDKFDVVRVIFFEENILRFDVSMDDSDIVKVNDCSEKLFNDDGDEFLMVSFFAGFEILEQITALAKFANESELIFEVIDLEKVCYVRVVEFHHEQCL